MEKLVRDRIPDIIRAEGKEPLCRIADREEYRVLLMEKLKEEVCEFEEAENLEELADVLEVVLALSRDLGHSEEELFEMNKKKRDARGSFDERIVLKLD